MRAFHVLATVILVVSFTRAGEGKPLLGPERTALVRATYSRVPPDILGVVEPIQVDEAGSYWDGGTSYVRLTDARGTELVACLDGRVQRIDPERDADYWVLSLEYIERRHLYLHADHPADSTAVEVLVRGPEEAAMYGLLLRWAKVQPRSEEIAVMEAVRDCPSEDMVLYRIHRLLETFDQRFGIRRPE